MGAHHSSTGKAPNASTDDDDYPMEQHAILSQYKVEHRLFPGSGRMMKTYQLQHKTTEATAVVKALWVDASLIDTELKAQRDELERIYAALKEEPHVAPFSYWIHQTEFQSTANNIMRQRQPVYLLRPHLYTTLSDRLASRPFFTPIEKMWMVHQLLQALEAMHRAKVCHGFLTTENVGLTSWNWVVLTDIASYKAHTQLPDDDPSEYMYFFQDHHHGGGGAAASGASSTMTGGGGGSGGGGTSTGTAGGGALASGGGTGTESSKKVMNREKRCYVAPERFVSQHERNNTNTNSTNTTSTSFFSKHNQLTPAMDMFSAGCVIMELWLNGDRALDLGDLMDYRRQSTLVPQLQQKLNKIESSALRAACRHMVQVDPTQRLSARAYLERLQASEALPKVMEDCLEPLLRKVSDPKQSNILTPDARLAQAALHYETVLWETVGVQDPEGAAYLKRILGKTMVQLNHSDTDGSTEEEEKENEEITEASTPADPEQTSGQSPVNDLFAETEALLKKLDSLALGEEDEDMGSPAYASTASTTTAAAQTTSETPDTTREKATSVQRSTLCKNSLLIFLQLILANIRHVQRPTSKLVALQILTRLCDLCDSDEIRLQRMVPVSISLLQDQDTLVRAAAIRFLTHTVSQVQSFPPSDSKIFPQYIFKRVSPLLTDPSLVVRLAFCQSIVVLAETAHRFLDISHAVRLYEAIGGGATSSGSTAAAAAAVTGATDASSGTEKHNKQTAPSGSNVFGDDVAKLLGDDISSSQKAELKKAKAGNESKQLQKQDSGAYHGDNFADTPSGKALISSNYQEELASLQEVVSRWVVHITTDPSEHSSPTKRALLDSHLSRLCTFFGLEGVMAFILPQILAFLNDRKDSQLRTALFRNLPSVCRIVGRAATEHFVLPCLETGLVDGEEQVIGAAVRCLAELIDLGLLSRSVLLGNLTMTPTADSVEMTSDGLLRRYSALLVHPSAEIRHGAIATVNAVCVALGSPDSEVYVAYLLHPYLRFQPSLRHLQTSDGLENCLYQSWSRTKFNKELAAFITSKQLQSDGTWTSIGVGEKRPPTKEPAAVNKAGSGGEPEKRASSTDVMETQISRVREYLQMIGKRKQPANSNSANNADHESGPDVLKNGIEGSLKLAQNIKFPRQDTIGNNQRTVPLWYSTLRDRMQAMDIEASETSAIRSVSALGQIYGLSIMAASDGTIEQIGSSNDYKPSDEEIRKLVNSSESKAIEAVSSGEWGSETQLDPVLLDTSLLITKLKALNVPPLPPRLGELRRPAPGLGHSPNSHGPRGSGKDGGGSGDWRPKADTLLASSSPITAHTAPVARIAVSLDQSFFVTGSYDGTCRVWEMSQIESSSGILDSSITYTGHSEAFSPTTARINDLAMVEGSHSVASASSNGSVHVWRVDLVSQAKQPSSQAQNEQRTNYQRSRVVGNSEIRQINPDEGEILAVSHFNSPSASVVAFATQKGTVHSWDLRSCVEPFALKHGPDIGYLTSMALGTDRNWILTGTSRGFLALWDLRFNQTVKLWHHSRAAPITRLATSFVPPPQLWGGRNLSPDSLRPFVFVSAGRNECAMFDITTGDCRECFRTVGFGGHSPHAYAEDIPSLQEVPITAACRRGGSALMTSGFEKSRTALAPSPVSSVNAMCGSIGVSDQSYLITGGGDARIRFWDFAVPSKCYVVSGQSAMQPRPSYERIDLDGPCRLLLCRQSPMPNYTKMGGAKLNKRLGNGLSKPENHHTDAIQDLKIVNNALISASRDCTVKVWR